MRYSWSLLGLPVAGLLLSAALWAAPLLHEYFDPTEASQTPPPADAVAASSAQAESAAVQARTETAQGGGSEPDRYTLDSNTSRPDEVGYSDPFTPAIPPFKRQYAFDAVNDQLELVVADPSLRRLKQGGTPLASDDQFLGNVRLHFSAATPLRVPSVGPGTRILGARLEPPAKLELFEDSAENWFVRSDQDGPHELVVHLAIERATFGSPIANTSWPALSEFLPPEPRSLQAHARPVLQRIGVSQGQTPAAAAARLIQYFREFAPSDDRSMASGAALYEAIALSQKGVCRHRSFAFVVSALALGLPSRFVHNEAHAWVEVFDGQLWHRVDLGGAAGHVGLSGALDVPHTAPADPFPWPANSERGQDMVDNALAGPGGAGGSARRDPQAADPNGANPNTAATAQPQFAPAAPSAPINSSMAPVNSSLAPVNSAVPPTNTAPALSAPAALPAASGDDWATAPQPEGEQPATTISLEVSKDNATRGSRVALSGRIQAENADCSLQRVNVLLLDSSGRSQPIGVLVSDASGRFFGEVVLPSSVPVGDYDLYVTTPGSPQCKSASSVRR